MQNGITACRICGKNFKEPHTFFNELEEARYDKLKGVRIVGDYQMLSMLA